MSNSAKIAVSIWTVVALIGLSVGIGAYILNKRYAKQEVRDWTWGSYKMICPPYDLYAEPSLVAETDKAAKHLEKELGTKLFVKSGGNVPVHVHRDRNPRHLRDYDQFCERKTFAGAMARVYRVPAHGPNVLRFDVVVCAKLIKRSRTASLRQLSIKQQREIRAAADFGLFGHIAHELLHSYLGDRQGHRHPRHSAGLMAKSPRVTDVGDVVKGIFARRILPTCNK